MHASSPPVIAGMTFMGNLGSGGFADVFLYEQELPRRQVAVKVLRIDLSDSELVARFGVEADAMAQLEHPNIVPVYFAAAAQDGRPFIAMMYYPRGSLAARLKRHGRFGVQETLRIGVQVASALETAHRARLLHRDIKPANIFFSQYGTPALGDFGIAVTSGEANDATGSGSLPWSPPEISFGNGPASVQSDVYSLAATIWHLLAGLSPFEQPGGDNAADALADRVRNAQVRRTGRSDTPESLERLLSASLAKEPRLRPRSALELARALQQVELELGFDRTEVVLASTDYTVMPSGEPSRTLYRPVSPAVGGSAAPYPSPVGTTAPEPTRLVGPPGSEPPRFAPASDGYEPTRFAGAGVPPNARGVGAGDPQDDPTRLAMPASDFSPTAPERPPAGSRKPAIRPNRVVWWVAAACLAGIVLALFVVPPLFGGSSGNTSPTTSRARTTQAGSPNATNSPATPASSRAMPGITGGIAASSRLAWSQELGPVLGSGSRASKVVPVAASEAGFDGAVVVSERWPGGSAKGVLVAFDLATGTINWRRELGGEVLACAEALLAGKVVCFTGGELSLLSPSDGNRSAGFAVSAQTKYVQVAGDAVYALAFAAPSQADYKKRVSVSATLSRYDSAGNQDWSVDRTLLFREGNHARNVIIEASDEAVAVLTPFAEELGQQPLLVRAGNGSGLNAGVGQGRVGPAGVAGVTSGLGAGTRTRVLSVPSGPVASGLGYLTFPATYADDPSRLPFLVGQLRNSPSLHAFDASGGTGWTFPGASSAPAYCGGRLIVQDEGSGLLAALDPTTGAAGWRYQGKLMPGLAPAGVLCDPQHVAFLDRDTGGLVALNLSDGAAITRVPLGLAESNVRLTATPGGVLVWQADRLSLITA